MPAFFQENAMTPYAAHVGNVPQTEAMPGQVANSAGGFSFAVDDWKRLGRFLILGSEGGSYYASERKLTVENAACVERCVKLDGLRVVRAIVAVSDGGRAPKNDPALLALAIAAKRGDEATRKAALAALPKVARIGTHLFHLAEFVKVLGGGWGRGTRNAFARWYESRSAESIVGQVIKYQSRDGWSHRDILRKCHAKAADETKNAALRWACKGWESVGLDPHPDPALARIWAFERAKVLTGSKDVKALCRLISEYGLPHECVPNEAKGDPKVWAALLPSMGLTALVRNLGKMTAVGLLKPMSAESKYVRDTLSDVEAIRKARLHPVAILVALKIYGQGHGDKGSLAWTPNQQIVDALDGVFYSAFKAVEPTGKSYMLALDVSGSMSGATCSGAPLSAREGSTAMALVTANVESDYHLMGFSARFIPLRISARSRLDDACAYAEGLPFERTDCSLPMRYALENKIPVDVFCVYTDNETYAGPEHPHVSLEKYRQKMGRAAKLVVVGMVANQFTIANPDDAGMLDVVGFDTATPSVISEFSR